MPSISKLKFSVAEGIRVHQHDASKACDFDPKRSKKASPNAKRQAGRGFAIPKLHTHIVCCPFYGWEVKVT